MIIALLVLLAFGALLLWSAFALDDHLDSRFGVSIFDIRHLLVNIAGWALITAGFVSGIEGTAFVVVGAVILIVQFCRLVAQTSPIHGAIAFAYISGMTIAIIFVIALAVSAVTDTRSRRVIIID